MLRIEIENHGARVCVRCQGALLRGADLNGLPEAARKAGGKTVLLDLKRVQRIDAHGVGIVAAMTDAARESGAELRVIHVSARVRTVFETCGLESLLNGGGAACSSAA